MFAGAVKTVITRCREMWMAVTECVRFQKLDIQPNIHAIYHTNTALMVFPQSARKAYLIIVAHSKVNNKITHCIICVNHAHRGPCPSIYKSIDS